VLRTLQSLAPGVNHVAHHANLSRLTETKRAGEAIAESEPRIDVLINNAGAIFTARQVTGEALEMTFATNHIPYFVLTNLLLPRIKATPGARIVSTSSNAHRRAKLDFDDLQMQHGYTAFGMYGRTKLMNILFTRELARRLAGTGVTANCLHPGLVNTRFGDASGGWFPFLVKAVKRFGVTPQEGAKTLIYLASSPEVEGVTGQYYYLCKAAAPTEDAQDDANARRLWELSTQLTGVGA
jgi:NAD(P)-dependent dehydrogenase (short-subunit alcohol dehydrogenase family)